MSDFREFCCICVCSKENLVRLSQTDEDVVSFYQKLITSIPEMCFKELKRELNACWECCQNIDTVYKFRKKCLLSKGAFINYVNRIDASTCEINGKEDSDESNGYDFGFTSCDRQNAGISKASGVVKVSTSSQTEDTSKNGVSI